MENSALHSHTLQLQASRETAHLSFFPSGTEQQPKRESKPSASRLESHGVRKQHDDLHIPAVGKLLGTKQKTAGRIANKAIKNLRLSIFSSYYS
jgi:hypothetical protein